MISYLDQQVGEIIAKLKEIGQYENTLMIFTSDNGPTSPSIRWILNILTVQEFLLIQAIR